MSDFISQQQHLWEVLILLFNLKKSAAETYRLIMEIYGDNDPPKNTCRWFKNNDFNVEVIAVMWCYDGTRQVWYTIRPSNC